MGLLRYDSDERFNYDDIIKYAAKYVDDKNNDIRNAAIGVIIEAAK